MMCLPTAVEPVNEIRSTLGSATSISPAMAGWLEVMTLNTPAGKPASAANSPMTAAMAGVSGAALRMIGAAGEQTRHHFADVDVQRHVPRGDGADHAQGFVYDHSFGVKTVVAPDAAVLLPGHLAETLEKTVHAAESAIDLRAGGGTER